MPTVTTNGIQTYYERRGEGPAVVFLHGAILDHSQWAPQLDALADAYTVVAYDIRGHGRTGGSDRDRYDVGLFAEDLDALLTALALDRVVLCGLSLGGCIAQVYAARSPERVAGLVLAGTFTPDYLSRSEWVQRSAALRATLLPVRLVGYERVQRAMAWAHERAQRGSSGEYAAVQRLQAEAPPIPTAEFTKTIRALARFHEAEIDYSAVTAPALVLHGEHEPGFVRRQAERLAMLLPDATVRVVPGAGHASNLDAPAFFTDAVRSFLARTQAGDAPTDAEGATA